MTMQNKRGQMLRTLVLIIVAIMIFAPILNGASKYLGIGSERTSNSFSDLNGKMKSFITSPNNDGQEIHTQSLAEESGIFIFANGKNQASLISHTNAGGTHRITVTNAVRPLDQPNCKDVNEACICLCSSGLDYEWYVFTKFRPEDVRNMKPPLELDINVETVLGTMYKVNRLSCPQWACETLPKVQNSIDVKFKEKTILMDAEFQAKMKKELGFDSIEEYFYGGFMIFNYNKLWNHPPANPPSYQGPYPLGKPGNSIIVMDRIKDNLGACYKSPCFTDEERGQIKHGPNWVNIKEFNKLQTAYNTCKLSQPLAEQDVPIALTGDQYMYLIKKDDKVDFYMLDDTEKTKMHLENVKLCADADQIQKEQTKTLYIRVENDECCLHTK